MADHNTPLRQQIEVLKREKKRINISGKTLLNKINKYRRNKYKLRVKSFKDIVDENKAQSFFVVMVKDYIENIENPISKINEICESIYREIEEREKLSFDSDIKPIGIENEFFCYKEIPFSQ